jgi:D-beta-D-heptose 7-phosphate kinase/D-beta-D-heptose 1-phosphate adenosyltransferase
MERAMRHIEDAVPRVDAIVAADYGKGFLTQPLADHIGALARAHGKVLAIDPHPHTSLLWRGATAIKPNRTEAFLAAGVPGADPAAPPGEDAALREVGRRLLERWGCAALLITLGELGMALFEPAAAPYWIPTRAREVFDVSGAGDTAIAVLSTALAGGATARQAAELANAASGIVVGKLGTATATLAELRAAAEGGDELRGSVLPY